jgi:hypothetical protein
MNLLEQAFFIGTTESVERNLDKEKIDRKIELRLNQ